MQQNRAKMLRPSWKHVKTASADGIHAKEASFSHALEHTLKYKHFNMISFLHVTLTVFCQYCTVTAIN